LSEINPPCTPGFMRRIASMIYDGLLVLALLLVATFPFVGLTGGGVTPSSRIALQLYLTAVCAGYFLWFWLHGGQTLPMKTWQIRLVTEQGAPINLRRALLRFLAALIGIACAGIGLAWALWDRDRQFLHDRVAGTRLTDVPRA
jgi:uncharacterized RDD family membrane protein YckC